MPVFFTRQSLSLASLSSYEEHALLASPSEMKVKQYRELIGILLEFLGYAIAVHSPGQETRYFNKNSLFKRAIFKEEFGRVIESDKILKHLFFSLFQQKDLKEPLTMDRLNEKINRIRSEIEKEQGHSLVQARNGLVRGLSVVQHMPLVPQSNRDELLKTLKPGDIFVSYAYQSYTMTQFAIRNGQKLTKPFIQGTDSESHHAKHVAIYLGEGKIAEASHMEGGIDVRILDIDHSMFRLNTGAYAEYRVYRPKADQHFEGMAELAVEAAKKCADYVPEKFELKSSISKKLRKVLLYGTHYKYSCSLAVKSLLTSSRFDDLAKKRFLKNLATQLLPVKNHLTKNGRRYFFCSYFVGWMLQAAQAQDVYHKLEKLGLKLPNLTFSPPTKPKVLLKPDSMSDKEYGEKLNQQEAEYQKAVREYEKNVNQVISKWAKENATKYSKELDECVDLQINTKRMTPQKFVAYMNLNPEKYTTVCRILPP